MKCSQIQLDIVNREKKVNTKCVNKNGFIIAPKTINYLAFQSFEFGLI